MEETDWDQVQLKVSEEVGSSLDLRCCDMLWNAAIVHNFIFSRTSITLENGWVTERTFP